MDHRSVNVEILQLNFNNLNFLLSDHFYTGQYQQRRQSKVSYIFFGYKLFKFELLLGSLKNPGIPAKARTAFELFCIEQEQVAAGDHPGVGTVQQLSIYS